MKTYQQQTASSHSPGHVCNDFVPSWKEETPVITVVSGSDVVIDTYNLHDGTVERLTFLCRHEAGDAAVDLSEHTRPP